MHVCARVHAHVYTHVYTCAHDSRAQPLLQRSGTSRNIAIGIANGIANGIADGMAIVCVRSFRCSNLTASARDSKDRKHMSRHMSQHMSRHMSQHMSRHMSKHMSKHWGRVGVMCDCIPDRCDWPRCVGLRRHARHMSDSCLHTFYTHVCPQTDLNEHASFKAFILSLMLLFRLVTDDPHSCAHRHRRRHA